MLVQKYKDMLSAKSVIRQLSEFATARGQEIGYDNVFDYSLGNPSVPVPKAFTDRMIQMLATRDPMELHGYSPALASPPFGKPSPPPWRSALTSLIARSTFSWRPARQVPWLTPSVW